jgi:hypothetical protein
MAPLGKAGDCPLLGRRPSRGLSRAGALPSPRRRRQAAVPATAQPVVIRRCAALSASPCATDCGRRGSATRHQPGSVAACAARASPPKPARRLSGGRLGPSWARLRRVAFAMTQAPPSTGPGRESPGPHSACRVEGRSGRSPSAPIGRTGQTEARRYSRPKVARSSQQEPGSIRSVLGAC